MILILCSYVIIYQYFKKNMLKISFQKLKILKIFFFDESRGHGKLLNKAIKNLNINTIWIKFDHDDNYSKNYIEEILSIIRISNCYFVEKSWII